MMSIPKSSRNCYMAKSINSLLFLLLLVLLLFKIFDFTQRYDHLPSSPNRFYSYVAVNLHLLMTKMGSASDGDHVFAAVNRKTLPLTPPQVAPLPALVNKEDIVALTEKNFSSFMAMNEHVMVIFHAPGWFFSPEYMALAMKLTGAEVAAEANFKEEKALADKFGITRYHIPIYFFPGGADLRDKYYSEWDIQGVNSMMSKEGMLRGKLFRRSELEDFVTNEHDYDIYL